MSSKIEAAREQGYSDEEILRFLSEKDSSFSPKIEEAQENGYGPSEIIEFIQTTKQPSKLRSFISAPIKGAAQSYLKSSIPSIFPGPISPKAGEKIVEKALPTRPEHEPLVRAGKVAPYVISSGASLPMAISEIALGTAAGEIAKESGAGEFGQEVAEVLGMGLPALAKLGAKAISSLIRKLKPGEAKKLQSGLTKLRVLEKSQKKMGRISPEREEKVINRLNTEASELAKKTIEREVPIVKEIEKGVDFEERFEKGFQQVKKLAQKAKPDIETRNLNQFMRSSEIPFRGIPKKSLSPETRKILDEVSAFRNKPVRRLDRLLTLFRENNKKLTSIYEQSRITGKQKHYRDFLINFNKEIGKSFETTLGKDSEWVKMFKKTNAEFKAFTDASTVLTKLKGFIDGVPTKTEVTKLATNLKAQRNLELKMGKKGAKEIIQISKDLKDSIEAIKKIPKQRLRSFNSIFPIYYLLPWGGKTIGTATALSKMRRFSKLGYGYWLSSPARRKGYSEAIKALNKNDLSSYKKKALILENLLNRDKED